MKKNGRLYLDVVERIEQDLNSGLYPSGSRLPSERELSEQMGVSRPVLREAVRVLESRGLLSIRHGAGVFVKQRPSVSEHLGINPDVGPFEVIEARRLLEGEIAAMAAVAITEDQMAELQTLTDRMADHSVDEASRERADKAFHVTLARATSNDLLANMVATLWDMRYKSALCEYYFRRAREAGIEPPADEHQAVLEALRARNPDAARQAMRDHLARVTHNLLIATEHDARDRERLKVDERRFDYARRAGVLI